MDFEQILEKSYNETFELTYKFLMPRTKLTLETIEVEIQKLEAALESLYIYLGQDWIGRGELVNNRISANVAATEAVIYDLKALKATLL